MPLPVVDTAPAYVPPPASEVVGEVGRFHAAPPRIADIERERLRARV